MANEKNLLKEMIPYEQIIQTMSTFLSTKWNLHVKEGGGSDVWARPSFSPSHDIRGPRGAHE
ncbi:hypothetical protein HPP92_024093 [Vanilla planifolia]|uniref:Uncharacterized protein n=1 Tax=Vanilla planifolia TaxID=51239 RepID=A0A835PM91_VANPL|nr:hypothetical protein HPP92_024093 [Vanilla planifolia]